MNIFKIWNKGRIKRILKLDSDVRAISKEATVAITKLTEIFIGFLALRVNHTVTKRNAKAIKDLDVIQTIQTIDSLSFLKLDFPKKLLPDAQIKSIKFKTQHAMPKQKIQNQTKINNWIHPSNHFLILVQVHPHYL